ncbi:MAG TPA: hypothetical protein VMU57_17295 [Edaphobacter sp.]|uniref:GspE/PulE/PilB domain-containing protein n=1 Tax=Edaphobacter sp. TaxID=1934404 RepID=UPI002CD19EF8|nr:hypothetical protein [Edaphobacter sp.]HUZ96660.1 hypothetical protein [Edaphobacter sp.]
MPWRSRRRPVFEEQWGCSGRCVLAMVRDALRREMGDRTSATTSALHHHRVPLGLLLLSQGWITHPQLRRALEAQRQNGTGRIGEWLIAECGLEAEQITRGLSLQWSCPVLSVEGFSPEAMALVMPEIFVERFGLMPLRIAGGRILYVAFEDHLDASASLAIERMTGLKVESGILNEVQFRAAQSRLLECDRVEVKIEAVSDADTLAGRITAILEQKQPVASRLVRLHHYYWLRLWLENGAVGKPGKFPFSGEDMGDYVFTVGAQG